MAGAARREPGRPREAARARPGRRAEAAGRPGTSGSRRRARPRRRRTGRPSRVCPASSARRSNGISDGSAIGSSRNHASRGSAFTKSAGSTTSSWWSVPKRAAVIRAARRSSKTGSSNPIVKLAGGSAPASRMRPSTAAESIPPERRTPSGTSLWRRRPGRVRKQRAELGGLERLGLRGLQAPVRPLDGSLAVVEEVGAGLEPPDAAEERPWRSQIAREEKLRHVLGGQLGLAAGHEEHRARIGAEGEPRLGLRDVERLLAQAITREEQPAARGRPRGRRRTSRPAARRGPPPTPPTRARAPRCRIGSGRRDRPARARVRRAR